MCRCDQRRDDSFCPCSRSRRCGLGSCGSGQRSGRRIDQPRQGGPRRHQSGGNEPGTKCPWNDGARASRPGDDHSGFQSPRGRHSRPKSTRINDTGKHPAGNDQSWCVDTRSLHPTRGLRSLTPSGSVTKVRAPFPTIYRLPPRSPNAILLHYESSMLEIAPRPGDERHFNAVCACSKPRPDYQRRIQGGGGWREPGSANPRQQHYRPDDSWSRHPRTRQLRCDAWHQSTFGRSAGTERAGDDDTRPGAGESGSDDADHSYSACSGINPPLIQS